MSKVKKILKLQRKIAALNGHKGYVFDAPKISVFEYREYRPIYAYGELSAILLSGLMLSLVDDAVVLIRTNQGVYRLVDALRVIRHQTVLINDTEVRIISPVTLQDVMILDFKILNSGGQCIDASRPISKDLEGGCIFVANCYT